MFNGFCVKFSRVIDINCFRDALALGKLIRYSKYIVDDLNISKFPPKCNQIIKSADFINKFNLIS